MSGEPVIEAVTEEVKALSVLDLAALRLRWRDLIGPPPKLRSAELLRHLLAWRLQSARFGGLDPQVRKRLKQTSGRSEVSSSLAEGALVVREWQGRRYEVSCVEGAYVYEGVTYRSLSAVARVITGVRWNGPRFFGLRPDAAP